jgi:hypothetical protein
MPGLLGHVRSKMTGGLMERAVVSMRGAANGAVLAEELIAGRLIAFQDLRGFRLCVPTGGGRRKTVDRICAVTGIRAS